VDVHYYGSAFKKRGAVHGAHVNCSCGDSSVASVSPTKRIPSN